MRSQWRTPTSLFKILALALVALAVCQELSKSPEQRTWHGRIAGLIPYDFRLPTAARIRDRLWNPDDPRVLTERVFGVGWTINFHSLLLKSRTRIQERNLPIPGEIQERWEQCRSTAMAARALIWDLDGVIADTAPFHFRSWQHVAEARGIPFAEADFRQTFGKRNPEIIAEKFGGDVSPQEAEDIANTKEEVFRRIARQSIKPFPGVLNLLLSLRSAGWSTAIASSTPPENIALILDSLEITGLFDAVVSSTDVGRGKPDPECFLLAAERLGVAPDSCVVIEDAVAGVQAAKSAGMLCIAVTNTHPAQKLAEADRVVDSLEGITAEAVAPLLLR